jgi:hypothetical protein
MLKRVQHDTIRHPGFILIFCHPEFISGSKKDAETSSA